MIFLIIVASLVLINFLLLKFSCDCGNSQTKISNKKKRLKENASKIWSREESVSNQVFAGK